MKGISLFYNLELVQKSVFQPPTTKPGNLGPRTVKTVRITPSSTVASCFEGGFAHVARGAHKSVHVSTSLISSLSMTSGSHCHLLPPSLPQPMAPPGPRRLSRSQLSRRHRNRRCSRSSPRWHAVPAPPAPAAPRRHAEAGAVPPAAAPRRRRVLVPPRVLPRRGVRPPRALPGPRRGVPRVPLLPPAPAVVPPAAAGPRAAPPRQLLGGARPGRHRGHPRRVVEPQ